MDRILETLAAEREISRVILKYSRAVDRYDFDSLLDCYWPDGTDDHGSFVGSAGDFVEWNKGALARFDLTCHFLGNILIAVDLDANTAHAETYAVAHHRFTDADGQLTDMTAGLRYVDIFKRRDGIWRILTRVIAYDWRRTDIATGQSGFADAYVTGVRSAQDVVYTIRDRPEFTAT
jgi:ketosteroid isomerase-like protein